MQSALPGAGLGNATRTRGMLPEETISTYKLNRSRLQVMQKRTPGAIGCWFGQVQVMRNALYMSRHALVMEDDLIFCKDFHKRMEIMTEFLAGPDKVDITWDVIWLGGTFHVNPPWWHGRSEPCLCKQYGPCPKRDAELTINPRIVRTYGAFSTHAYIVNVYSIEKVLKMLDEILHLSMGIDWAFIQHQPRLKCYAFAPGCVIQMDNQSDIGRGITCFSGFKKLGPYWYAEKMEDFDPTTFNWAEARNER